MANNVISTVANDGFSVQEKASSSSIIGRLVKFVDGQFRTDKVEILPIGTRLVANAVVTAWMHWVDGKPVDHLVTQPGQLHPDREDMPELDPANWPPGLNSEPNDPWKDTRYLHLIDRQTGADYTFVTDSFGGRRAIAELKSQIANVRSAHPMAIPMVALGSVPWKTKFGTKLRPQFNVVEWIDRNVTGPKPELPDDGDAPF
jgi:hypothetical protein